MTDLFDAAPPKLFDVEVHDETRGWHVHAPALREVEAQDLVVTLRLQGLYVRRVPQGGE